MSETRNRWDKGIVRHLRLDPDCPPDQAFAIRPDLEIFYTLVINPKHEDRVIELRARLEASPHIGGAFSPERDV